VKELLIEKGKCIVKELLVEKGKCIVKELLVVAVDKDVLQQEINKDTSISQTQVYSEVLPHNTISLLN
jgi:hypothetical protein